MDDSFIQALLGRNSSGLRSDVSFAPALTLPICAVPVSSPVSETVISPS